MTAPLAGRLPHSADGHRVLDAIALRLRSERRCLRHLDVSGAKLQVSGILKDSPGHDVVASIGKL